MNRWAAVAAIALVTGAGAGGVVATAATPTTTVAPSTSVVAAATSTAAPTTSVAAPTSAATTTALAAPSTTLSPTTLAPTTSTTVPAPIGEGAIRSAKVGWSAFVAENFATPNAILDPCPLMTVADADAGIAGLGLLPSDLPFGVSLYRDTVGTGIIGITCGADLAAAASPAGATLFAVEVTILDGQAVFPQYVERVAGRNTPIERAAPELGGQMFARCRTEPIVCVAGWHSDGLIVTVKLDGPRTADSETHARRLLVVVAPQVVANLATVVPST